RYAVRRGLHDDLRRGLPRLRTYRGRSGAMGVHDAGAERGRVAAHHRTGLSEATGLKTRVQAISDLYVALAGRIAEKLNSPRVRTLHVPPATGTKDAEFCALELEDGAIGFSYILLAGTEAALRER